MSGARVQPRSYIVTIWPPEMERESDASVFCVQVDYSGDGLWLLRRGSGWGQTFRYTEDGWSFRKPPLKLPLEQALNLAQELAPGVEVNGFTAEQCLQWHREGCPRDEKGKPL